MSDGNYLVIGKYTIILTVLCISIMIFTIVRRVMTKKYKGDHMASGMIIGISSGIMFDRSGFGLVMGLSIGEIIGMTIGVLIPKK